MPDFGYWSWPLDLVGQYEQICSEMRENEVKWEKEVPKALWRGAVKTNKEVRGALMEVTRGKPWADVNQVTWKSRLEVTEGSAALPIVDHCNYQFLIHTQGKIDVPSQTRSTKLTITMIFQDAATLAVANTFSTALL